MAITTNEALHEVKQHLTDVRYTHTLGVRDTALALAKQYGADESKAELAAILHDICKYHDVQTMQDIVRNKLHEPHWGEYGNELLHAPCGAYFAERQLGVKDKDILLAIRFHTTGRAGMGLLEKVLFVADYIEPNRRFPGVEQARKLAEESLDAACCFALRQTMFLLLDRKQLIHPETVSAYNAFYKQKGAMEFE
ncbi:bis(5'-nucleosyl)-tetraphosphatase (symmetrical) YqeK [Shouchella clausii]|uniref:bis(5'-nucleosyl)-tetraphosphatase (symmetrical) n=1 Tax=Shouchella clausii TaxID=79880 RepID=A0A268P453_SHOCL|nr:MULTISPECIES: bis(5'-nucleosyl)-tetraphosphatase (symmetrical) YqeK [Shouchella]ALA51194.1 Hydrolase (HAD superfamily), YqeK [Shouchella clausii]KKI85000.1 phosphohydrolase [Shouchella clausii]MBU3231985.1 bis(5'-nucleosyl)-tetraphosphatase (symmetrical) YqeK [Shouchella clausii]MBU3264731.1 bis(5'-nucleosyl)-tetraphosphatase (symmetrical) YqeK [Shouchella clausii]MBU3507806.1 bis(5'-nucleosyl)-tetraphosphatase (symmetrical) YqeK [Shouchella clausii]